MAFDSKIGDSSTSGLDVALLHKPKWGKSRYQVAPSSEETLLGRRVEIIILKPEDLQSRGIQTNTIRNIFKIVDDFLNEQKSLSISSRSLDRQLQQHKSKGFFSKIFSKKETSYLLEEAKRDVESSQSRLLFLNQTLKRILESALKKSIDNIYLDNYRTTGEIIIESPLT